MLSTGALVLPIIKNGKEQVCFMTDLVPMEIFMEPGTWCGYDLDPELQLREKQEFLQKLIPGSRLIFFHDTLKESILFQ